MIRPHIRDLRRWYFQSMNCSFYMIVPLFLTNLRMKLNIFIVKFRKGAKVINEDYVEKYPK